MSISCARHSCALLVMVDEGESLEKLECKIRGREVQGHEASSVNSTDRIQ
jgi:hypothetical protein